MGPHQHKKLFEKRTQGFWSIFSCCVKSKTRGRCRPLVNAKHFNSSPQKSAARSFLCFRGYVQNGNLRPGARFPNLAVYLPSGDSIHVDTDVPMFNSKLPTGPPDLMNTIGSFSLYLIGPFYNPGTKYTKTCARASIPGKARPPAGILMPSTTCSLGAGQSAL